MSDDHLNDFFAPPPFRPEEALVGLKRQLRDLRPLAERGHRFELQGKPVVDITVDGANLQVKFARRPAMSPDWDTLTLKSGADVRKCIDEVRKRLARWQQDAE